MGGLAKAATLEVGDLEEQDDVGGMCLAARHTAGALLKETECFLSMVPA